MRGFLTAGVAAVTVDYSGQAVFELGVLLCVIAVRKHPLPGYPAAQLVDGGVAYPDAALCDFDAGLLGEMAAAGYPSSFLPLIRSMTSCDPGARPSLAEVKTALEGMVAPVCACGLRAQLDEATAALVRVSV